MVAGEQALLLRCQDIEDAVREGDPEDWTARYIERLRPILDECISSAREAVDRGETGLLLHAHRRLVAGVYQEIELHSQGASAVGRAALDRAFILHGCRCVSCIF
ncbi:hypothetical protein BV25DRAFT_1816351 [Artomyces pyxidatus]|uniref:Uncharacterized protein n=1 Tax=Artomyces pyxidatus TaxID=48021 RepID=A0ACB8SGA1_9AGAM|nr:hypothetical protein BV25DRAFT_1816351 [Artomyces pyxidatus]